MQLYNFNRIWNRIKRSRFATMVQRESDLPLAMDLLKGVQWAPSMAEALGRGLLARPLPLLQGASGYGDESRRWLHPDIAGVMDFSGTGSEGQFNIFDWILVDVIGYVFAVAGTTTACKVDFDLYPAPNAKGTILAANLDGTNGTVTAPNITTSMAIGAVVYKMLTETGPVLCRPGNSIDVDVATACTLGTEALAYVLCFPKPETFANLSAGFLGT